MPWRTHCCDAATKVVVRTRADVTMRPIELICAVDNKTRDRSQGENKNKKNPLRERGRKGDLGVAWRRSEPVPEPTGGCLASAPVSLARPDNKIKHVKQEGRQLRGSRVWLPSFLPLPCCSATSYPCLKPLSILCTGSRLRSSRVLEKRSPTFFQLAAPSTYVFNARLGAPCNY